MLSARQTPESLRIGAKSRIGRGNPAGVSLRKIEQNTEGTLESPVAVANRVFALKNPNLANRHHAYLAPWLEEASQARVESLGVKGGFSDAVIWQVSTPNEQLCLRRWPQAHPSLRGLLAIHGLMEHVASRGFRLSPVPKPTREGTTCIDYQEHLWDLTTWMPGEPSFAQNPSRDKLRAAMEALARFHQAALNYSFDGAVSAVAPSPGLRQRLNMLEALQTNELTHLWSAARASAASNLRDLAFEMLEYLTTALPPVKDLLEHVVEVPLQLQWCLRDVRHDHLLFTGNEVTGLIDFGAAGIDSVAGDVARLLGSTVNDDQAGWQAGIATYHHQRRLSPAELRAIPAFDQAGLLCSAANWVRWLFVEGRSFPQLHALHAQLIWLRDRLAQLAKRSTASTPASSSGPTWLETDRNIERVL